MENIGIAMVDNTHRLHRGSLPWPMAPLVLWQWKPIWATQAHSSNSYSLDSGLKFEIQIRFDDDVSATWCLELLRNTRTLFTLGLVSGGKLRDATNQRDTFRCDLLNVSFRTDGKASNVIKSTSCNRVYHISVRLQGEKRLSSTGQTAATLRTASGDARNRPRVPFVRVLWWYSPPPYEPSPCTRTEHRKYVASAFCVSVCRDSSRLLCSGRTFGESFDCSLLPPSESHSFRRFLSSIAFLIFSCIHVQHIVRHLIFVIYEYDERNNALRIGVVARLLDSTINTRESAPR